MPYDGRYKEPCSLLIRANGNSRLPTVTRRLEFERKTGGRISARNSIRTCSIRHRLSDTSPPLILHLHVANPRPHRSSTSPTNEPDRSARHKSGATSLILCPGKARPSEGEPCRWPLEPEPHQRQQNSGESAITFGADFCSLFVLLLLLLCLSFSFI
jgi:hypothetical protein